MKESLVFGSGPWTHLLLAVGDPGPPPGARAAEPRLSPTAATSEEQEQGLGAGGSLAVAPEREGGREDGDRAVSHSAA